MFVRPGLLAAALLLTVSAQAQQKRPLDHGDYERWRTISDERISDNGRWTIWREAPDTVGDSRVVVSRPGTGETYTIPRGDNPRFAGGFVVATVAAPYDSTRQARMDGKKGDDLPGDSVAVLDLATGSLTMYGPAQSWRVPEEDGEYAAILMEEVSKTDRDSTAAEAAHDKSDGNQLLLLDLARESSVAFESVRDYRFADNGSFLAFTAESADGQADGVFVVETGDQETWTVMDGEGYYRNLTIADTGDRLAFVSNSTDFASDQPSFALYVAEPGQEAVTVAREGDAGVPAGWWISEHGRLDFSDSGHRLFFRTSPRPDPEVEDNRPDNEKVDVDIWSWTDKDLMTVQLVNQSRDRERSYVAVADLNNGTLTQLADQLVPSINDLGHGDGAVAFGTDRRRYMPESSWDTPGYGDVYVIDMASGTKRRLLEAVRSNVIPSPDGSHLAWWDGQNRAWRITGFSNDPESVITSTIAPPEGVRFENELHDSPAIPGSNGSAGWSSDGRLFIFYDRYDLWAARPNGERWSLTNGAGRKAGQTYRYVRLDADARSIDLSQPVLLSVFDQSDKSGGFATATVRGGRASIEPLVMEPKRYSNPVKAKDSDELLLSRQSYTEFPDLWLTTPSFDTWTRLSQANPQQDEYTWGSIELVHWTSTDGQLLDGLLYKPEGFVPSEEYPMMVYFYEKSSSGLHSHHAPAPGRSVINRTFYTSRGYLVFVPDIPYKDGYPGESAMNAVMPGVTGLIDQGFVDRDRIGVQGHSWGGYQIAYMVTRTNLFAAAEAGAPVANMFSAYGGIRWQTGLSRMFQYERTQSRIGGTIWEKPLRYIENSPLFWLDKVETPLLIMHNDNDGHVPWYQGIELFVALRRLGKPAWLINYNGEPHWPLPYFKRLDWTTRMQQYFDHYLMDAPAPRWLDEGVPAVDKGRDWGLAVPTDSGSRG